MIPRLLPRMSVAVTVTCRALYKRGLKVVPSLLRNWPSAMSRFSPFSIRRTVNVNGGSQNADWLDGDEDVFDRLAASFVTTTD